MRKLKLQVQTSVDGFVAGPNGEMDWMVWDWDEELKTFVGALTDSIDTILLGRKMSEGFFAHWENVANNPDDPEHVFGKNFVDTPKVVFSKTITEVKGKNAVLAKGDLSEEVNVLKKQKGKDIIVYGGANFVSSLIKAKLIDEFNLFISPAVIGKGMSIFQGLEQKQDLTFVKSVSYKCGIVVLTYALR